MGVLLSPIKAKDDFILNSTRVTDNTLWTMALEDNNIYQDIFIKKLRAYALDCCSAPVTTYGYGHSRAACGTKQIAFWASVDKSVWDNNQNQKDALLKWLDGNYNPKKASTSNDYYAAKLICGKEKNANLPYLPNFAIMLKTTGNSNSNVGHTEDILIKEGGPMRKKVDSTKVPAHFFLYTFNSPCGDPPFSTTNCQKAIFDFTREKLYTLEPNLDEYLPYHTLTVGLYQWYKGRKEEIANARMKFCQSVTALKKNNINELIDFSNGLYFKKVKEQDGDVKYQKDMSEVNEC